MKHAKPIRDRETAAVDSIWIKEVEKNQTSLGTLYFFITIPASQSIRQRVSPPHVATRAPENTLGSGHLTLGQRGGSSQGQTGSVPGWCCCGWKEQDHSWVEKSSQLSSLLWHCRTWTGFRHT